MICAVIEPELYKILYSTVITNKGKINFYEFNVWKYFVIIDYGILLISEYRIIKLKN